MKSYRISHIILSAALTLAVATPVQANDKIRNKRYIAEADLICATYLDSLSHLADKYRYWNYVGTDTLGNPYYFPLFAAPTFYAAPISRQLGTLPSDSCSTATDARAELIDEIDRTLIDIYTHQPWLIRYAESEVGRDGADSDFSREYRPEVKLAEKTEAPAPDDFGTGDDWRIVVRKPNFWTFKTNTSLQLTQNYISSNWYKGGESSNSWLMQMNFEATYNNKQKVVLTNTLEAKLGFLSQRNDEKHNFRTNSDLLRMTNKLGLRATKRWYYTIMLQSWTQFYRGYRSNDDHVYSDFMSPFESLISIGMDYSLNVKNFTLSATISPLAGDFKYVDRGYLATSFGIDEGKHTDWSYGSNITMRYNWNICKNISWNGRIYYYTDYSKVQLEWENTFNLKINKYLATKLFLYPRFDDSVNRKEGDSYIQFNELLSFGLDISF